MLEELVVAGFGGQGVLSLGMTLSYAGMVEDKEISWMPSYGPEMRGGTANCITILSDRKISSPIIASFDSAIVLNQPSMDKFAAKVKPGGLLLYETDTVLQPSTRTDIQVLGIPAMAAARELGQPKAMNMVLLGAYLAQRPIVSMQSVQEALRQVLPEKYHHTLPLNYAALERGYQLMQQVAV
ncbi:MAG TPA: 2-oxoacid:acceptor oxidoreductase family protein [Lacibacter sp.]|nr:2-oxoacid:acceptor oxidoreductase family protein [Lacibacter sp.]HMO89951.1 2-oxoacid:acceptor oxidoreductase family protein [Lacibacter sp.]HMP85825.1 2-oxoacid:acceptor oxidoreductase family protein [Lacibacter sp.]